MRYLLLTALATALIFGGCKDDSNQFNPDASTDTDTDTDTDSDTDSDSDTEPPEDTDSGEFCDYNLCSLVTPSGHEKCFVDDSETTCASIGGIDPPECFNPDYIDYCGQDPQYADHERQFVCYDSSGDQTDCSALPSTSVNETVKDTLTKLTWQRHIPEELNWAGAIGYCNNLEYAGYQDWRLPNPHEFMSIVKNGVSEPSIDEIVFPQTPPLDFWTPLPCVADSVDDKSWVVHFRSATLTYKLRDQTNHVRCVRGGLGANGVSEETRYEVSEPVVGEAIVFDVMTKLIWQKAYEDSLDWKEALSYCANLNWAGQTDWRLPKIKELMSVANYSKDSAASDLPDIRPSRFWSSTPSIENPYELEFPILTV